MAKLKTKNKILIIGNWKMNPDNLRGMLKLGDRLDRTLRNFRNVEVVVCPPFVYMGYLKFLMPKFALGAQNCFWKQSGAFTGEVSPQMLKKLGCEYVILGHSERKNYLAETTEMINRKVKAALDVGIVPVVCIGEKQKQGGMGELEKQIKEVSLGVEKTEMAKIVLVYEPEWAISTTRGGKAATPQDSQRAIEYMRQVLSEMYDKNTAEGIQILYGGSVEDKNVRTFLVDGQADGVLVGAASLNAREFVKLVRNAAGLQKTS